MIEDGRIDTCQILAQIINSQLSATTNVFRYQKNQTSNFTRAVFSHEDFFSEQQFLEILIEQ